MKRLLLPFLLILTSCVISYAQTVNYAPAVKRCSSYDYYQQMLREDPQFAVNQAKIEAFTQQYIKNQSQSAANKYTATVYKIPVIVHVVYKTNAQNISTAQIQSQINVLNQDYQKLNSDVTKVPSVWTSLVADCQIQFCLAAVDPYGNSTTGIIRKKTNKTSFSTNNAVKHSGRGGDNAWPASDYLNIWVCHLGGGVLGYAQFPGGTPANDGVVIDFKAFGNTGTAAYPYNLGRTATHEVGHWLNLRHIWGDDGTSCSGSDFVDDTPNQADEHYGCPSFPQVSCSNGPNGDMYMNYMDYTDDRCMYMFSNGQSSRMAATIVSGGSRYSVTVSGKCNTPFVRSYAYIARESNLTVTPNPVISGVLAFSYTLHSASKVQATVYNIYGIAIKSINLGNQSSGDYRFQPITLNRMQNGVYVIKLIANNEVIGSTRFVVNK